MRSYGKASDHTYCNLGDCCRGRGREHPHATAMKVLVCIDERCRVASTGPSARRIPPVADEKQSPGAVLDGCGRRSPGTDPQEGFGGNASAMPNLAPTVRTSLTVAADHSPQFLQ